ncbi:MAG: GNAT family protein [Bacteroidia bacterium]|nr:GNAT family protein [Bacteroidia bacterium]
MSKWLNKITLSGNFVHLEPLETEHIAGLIEAAKDGNLWELWYTSVPDAANTESYVLKALKEYENEKSLPFAVIEKNTGKVIGSTRYMNVDAATKRLEIGSTWYAQSYQKTGVNKECKYLLLQHAFETLECIAVEFRTHWHNTPSRNAIASLGAKQDGVLRNHLIDSRGNYRDTVVFSILNSEWNTVKTSLAFKLSKHSY